MALLRTRIGGVFKIGKLYTNHQLISRMPFIPCKREVPFIFQRRL